MTSVFIGLFIFCVWLGLIFVALSFASMSKPVPRPLNRSPNVKRIKEETL